MTDPRAEAVVVRRLLPASPGVVYDEWLDPDALADWMCPRPARCLSVASEPRVGGRLRIGIEEGGVQFYVSGEYLALERPSRLSFTWSCSTWPDPRIRTVVSVLLEPWEGGQTLMTIEHTLLPAGLAGQHARGWTAIAGQLAEELAAAAPGS
ncbi:MAG TPA: SRPBCC domain-containing protein [Streptosporangiaceae bacterium]